MKKFLLLSLMVVLSAGLVLAQERTVSGRVTDEETGEPIPGANIIVKGTTSGTITDFEGNYSLSVPDGATLVYSFVGYAQQEVAVGSRSVIDVSLALDVQALSEVVVVGYGTQEKKEITSAVTSVSSKEFNAGNIQNPQQLLQGKVSGLVIARPGSDPNGGFNIRLRGISSLGASQEPLFVVDGVIMSSSTFSTIVDPNDIETIDVLKDASAAAIYGVRGNAGVLLVTTKTGSPGKPEVNYNMYAAIEEVAETWNPLSADEFRSVSQEVLGEVTDFGGDTDWFDAITRTSVSHVHNLSFSGGSDQTSYRMSFTARDVEGIQERTGFTRYLGRLNLKHSVLDNILTFTSQIAFVSQNSSLGFDEAYRYSVIYNPTAPVRDPDNPDQFFEVGGFDRFNPAGIVFQNDNLRRQQGILASLKGEIDLGFLVEGLRASGSYAQIRSSQIATEFYDKNSLYVRTSFFGNTNQNGFVQKNTTESFSELIESTVNYDKTFGDFDVALLGGYSYQAFDNQGFALAGGDFTTDAVRGNNPSFANDFANGLGAVGGFRERSLLIAGFGRLNVTYQGTYFLSASLRREGSTVFGEDNKWGNFPGISAGVELTNIVDIPNVNTLKLRGSYGITGGVPQGTNLTALTLAPSGSVLVNGTFVPAFGPVQNANPDLQFEEKKEFDVGLDFALFDSKLQGTFDYYTRVTEDLLIPAAVPVPPNLANTTLLNAGEFENDGFEITLSYRHQITDELEWETSGNWSTFNTELTKFTENEQFRSNAGAPGQNAININRVAVGEELGQIFAPVVTGIDEAGDWVYADLDGDGVIEQNGDDRTTVGNGLPSGTWGWNNTFRYKGFELNFFWRGTYGHQLANMTRNFYQAASNNINQFNVLSSYDELSDLTAGPAWGSIFVEDADFIALDNATFSYKLPLGDNQPFQEVRFFVSGNNLVLFTNYSGVDPEVRFADTGSVDNGGRAGSPDPLSPGIDRRNTWFRSRTYTIGANIKI